MMNVCYNCGEYRPDKTIDPAGPYAMCPRCGFKHPFLRPPLLVVGGASGTGKSTVCRALPGTIGEVVLLEGDILWRPEFNKPEEQYREFFETWLRLCKSIAHSGRPVVIFNAGMGVPENLEGRVERRYFSEVYYLAPVCEDDVLTHRLRGRPRWRKSGTPEFVEQQVTFNRWFKKQGRQPEPAIDLIDTTDASVEETAEQVAYWIRGKAGCTCHGHASDPRITGVP